METGCLSMGSDAQCQDENILDQGGPKSHDKCPPKRQKRDTKHREAATWRRRWRWEGCICNSRKIKAHQQASEAAGAWGVGHGAHAPSEPPVGNAPAHTWMPGIWSPEHKKTNLFSATHFMVLSEDGLRRLICLDMNTSMLY